MLQSFVLDAVLMVGVILPMAVMAVFMMSQPTGRMSLQGLRGIAPSLLGAFVGIWLGLLGVLSVSVIATIPAGVIAMVIGMTASLGLVIGYAISPHSEAPVVSQPSYTPSASETKSWEKGVAA